jgi:hypothetical protein
MKTSHDYFIDFEKDLKKCTDDQLVARFNLEVNNKGSGSARFSFLAALHNEFNRRGFDYSEIGDQESLSFRDKITLENKITKKLSPPKFL